MGIDSIRAGVLACIIWLAAGVYAPCGRAEDGASSQYLQLVEWADEAVGQANWERAIACLQEAMRTEPANPHNVLLLSNVGMIHFYAGEDSLALRTLSEARAMAPGSPVILANRAKVLLSMGRPDDAVRDYDKILEMDSTYADAYSGRAAVELGRNRYAEAERDIARYRELRPADSHGTLLQAVLYANTSRQEEAAVLYTELLKTYKDPVYYAARAMCRLVTGDLTGAADDIALGLEQAPEDGELYFCRAYLNHLRFRDSDRDADAAIALRFGIDKARVSALPKLPR